MDALNDIDGGEVGTCPLRVCWCGFKGGTPGPQTSMIPMLHTSPEHTTVHIMEVIRVCISIEGVQLFVKHHPN